MTPQAVRAIIPMEDLEDRDIVSEPTPVSYLDRYARARPFVKWVGGKRALIPEIIRRLPVQDFDTYWEPFVGGGAVFFALDSRITKAELSDTNLDLAITYTVVKQQLDALLAELRKLAELHSKEHYLKIRRETETRDNVRLAARFIYLNKTCYNGLYRVNRRNEFNVPMGSYRNPKICDEPNLRSASAVLAKATIAKRSFLKVSPGQGDLVYCDPPYFDTYAGYTKNGFGARDHEELRDACLKWKDLGAHVLVSNSDTPFVRHLYSQGFTIHEVNGRRSVSCKGGDRGPKPELLIVA